MSVTTPRLAAVLGLACISAAVQAAGAVQVSFVQPDKFTDAGDARRDTDRNLDEVKRHFEVLAARHLADGQTLGIEVLDVDLAGEVRPSRRTHQDARILKGGVDWPRIKLRYTLQGAGAAPRSAEQTLSDMGYLHHVNRYPRAEPLRYEKRMLDEWFAAQFGRAAAP